MSEPRFSGVTRRTFLGGAAAVTGAALLEQALVYRDANAVLAGGLLGVNAPLKPSFSMDVHRREDFLLLARTATPECTSKYRLGAPDRYRLPEPQAATERQVLECSIRVTTTEITGAFGDRLAAVAIAKGFCCGHRPDGRDPPSISFGSHLLSKAGI